MEIVGLYGFSRYGLMSLFDCRRGCGAVILFFCLLLSNNS